MVNAIGSAAQQISSNLSRLKNSAAPQNAQAEADSADAEANNAQNAQSGNVAANMGSKVSKGLMRLKSASEAGTPDKADTTFARNGVDVSLSKEARALLQSS